MRIQFYNPHVDDFLADPPQFKLVGRRPLKKYGYLLQSVIAEEGAVRMCVDSSLSAFVPARIFRWFPGFLRRWVSALEVKRWITINGLHGKVTIERQPSEEPDTIVLLFSYKGATGIFELRQSKLARSRALVAHMSHYFVSTQEKSKNLQKLPGVILAGDADISANPYFRHFFSWYRQPFLTLPFTVAPRFTNRIPFADRQPRAVATGTYHDLENEMYPGLYEDFRTFFKSSTYHPVRKQIAEQREKLESQIVSHVNFYREAGGRAAMFKRLRSFLSVAQKAYFSIDLVELYNSHRYAIVGEEASGFPALGAFEAMACGCTLIAQPEFYAGWDMQPGVHFVAHDGSLASIIDAIDRMNAEPERASAIARAGTDLVDRTFRSKPAYAAAKERLQAVLSRGPIA